MPYYPACTDCGAERCDGCGVCHACEDRRKAEATDARLDAEEKQLAAENDKPEAPVEKDTYVNCRGCGKRMLWTGIYGDWCATCMPRTLPPSRSNIRFRQTSGGR